jgi:thiol-disulfide isomerase/thioredoxin
MNKQLLTETLKKESVIVFFYADWCGGCKVASPMINTIAEKLNFRTIRINENEELEQEFAVDYYPHVIVASKGNVRHYPGLEMIKNLYEQTV